MVMIDIFIVAYLLLAWFWVLPRSSPFTHLFAPLRKYVRWSGLWHSWNVFAPNPTKTNRYLQAEITFASGAIRIWKPPRLSEFGRLKAFLLERHKKYQLSLLRPIFLFAKPALCEHLARSAYTPEDPPSQVTLFCYYNEVPPPDAIPSDTAVFSRITVFVHQVRPIE